MREARIPLAPVATMKPMRRLSLVLAALSLLAIWPRSAAAAPPTVVEVIKVEGAIDRPLLGYLNDRLDAAESEGAVVVLQIDTAGTLDEDGMAFAERVAGLAVPVIAWVGPAPARASGAGLLLMYASSLAGVSPGSQTGPLYPIDLAHPEDRPEGARDTVAGWLKARDKQTDIDWNDRPLTAAEARHRDIAQVAATSIPDLLDRIDGRTVRTPAGPVVLQTRIATTEREVGERAVNIRFENLGPVNRVLHGVASPSMVYLLLVLALAALAFELTQPGFGFAGFAGVGMLALGLYGLTVVPVDPLGLALLVGGIGLMVLDVRARKLGPLTVAGLIAFSGGSVLAWRDMAAAMRISPWLIGGAVVASALYYGFALTVAIQSRDRIVNAQRGLIGLVGEARGRLAPDGPVYVKGTMWRGRSTGSEIASGAAVRVRGVDGLILQVEAEPDIGRPDEPAQPADR
jgi:membrane-bound serine protease (ClpP class)